MTLNVQWGIDVIKSLMPYRGNVDLIMKLGTGIMG
jgi:hypothetical protein